jgi:phosphohistidine phosphatase SixA
MVRPRLLALLVLSIPIAAGANDSLWALLKGGGQVVLLRHALTDPGAGDPPGFALGDCGTQRNLSAIGREDARRIGDAFKKRGIPVGSVLSSRWCRCLETGRLAFGRAEPWAMLDSVFEDRRHEPEQTRAVRALLAAPPGGGNVVLITHGVNVSALLGFVPAPGELVVVTPDGGGGFRVAGRLLPSALD